MKLTHYKFRLGMGVLFAAIGLAFIVGAVFQLVGPRPHGLGHFYEFVTVGPLLVLAGIGCCYDK